MRQHRWAELSIVLAVLTLASCSDPVTLPPLSQDAVIVAFGDSLTSGSGATNAHDYPTVLSGLTGRKVINAGVPGEVSSEGLQRLPGVLDANSPRLLILIHGGNDLLREMDQAETRANLAAMIQMARDRGVSVAMLGVPDRGLFLHSADFYQSLAEEFSVPIDTDTLPDILSNKSLKSDLVHPNDEGYRQMAEAVYQLLGERGAL